MDQNVTKSIEKILNTKTSERSVALEIKKLVRLLDGQTFSDEERAEVIGFIDDYPDENWFDRKTRLKRFFIPGEAWHEFKNTYGWVREGQAIACPIPMSRVVDLWNVLGNYIDVDGFAAARALPYNKFEDCLQVDVPLECRKFWQKYGYANPCELQYRRLNDKLVVDRSIISFGFWKAYRWWEGCWFWYEQKRPEDFADEYLPKPDLSDVPQGVAVLGSANKNYWEAQKIILKK